jgi:hypothetical protein
VFHYGRLLNRKQHTILERLARNKHSDSLQKFVT